MPKEGSPRMSSMQNSTTNKESSSSSTDNKLNDIFICENDKKANRFEDFSHYCTICELHIKDEKAIPSHIKTVDHFVFSNVSFILKHSYSYLFNLAIFRPK